ncbi:MAG TPA: bifunctional N-acetylglucosamine-1-phosphate uridyltransferase/glucosamine-1-phosphate acetyltransferase, partial [Candidatus Cloacimonadota bacterium]|nr:bifunctional N-acetylglucosamine-1-phosphate uridyltransferase/glucosamine-1-phosphate acetyltransferase [Candidatus Cloacimonadota bacterium]
FNNRINNHWLNNGVVIENPATVIISEDAIIENDVTIQAGTVIRGNSVIKKNSIIGVNCYLEDANILSNCILKGYNIVIDKQLESGTILNWQEKQINE